MTRRLREFGAFWVHQIIGRMANQGFAGIATGVICVSVGCVSMSFGGCLLALLLPQHIRHDCDRDHRFERLRIFFINFSVFAMSRSL